MIWLVVGLLATGVLLVVYRLGYYTGAADTMGWVNGQFGQQIQNQSATQPTHLDYQREMARRGLQ